MTPATETADLGVKTFVRKNGTTAQIKKKKPAEKPATPADDKSEQGTKEKKAEGSKKTSGDSDGPGVAAVVFGVLGGAVLVGGGLVLMRMLQQRRAQQTVH